MVFFFKYNKINSIAEFHLILSGESQQCCTLCGTFIDLCSKIMGLGVPKILLMLKSGGFAPAYGKNCSYN